MLLYMVGCTLSPKGIRWMALPLPLCSSLSLFESLMHSASADANGFATESK